MRNRELIDDGAGWFLPGNEQRRLDRAAGAKTLWNMLSVTTSARAKELVKQAFRDKNCTIALGRIRELYGKMAGVAKLTDVPVDFQ